MALALRLLLTIAWMWTGRRMTLLCLAIARKMLCWIHQLAYVPNLNPRVGSKRSAALMRPREPSCMRSMRWTPEDEEYLLAMVKTRRRLRSTKVCFASRPRFRPSTKSSIVPRGAGAGAGTKPEPAEPSDDGPENTPAGGEFKDMSWSVRRPTVRRRRVSAWARRADEDVCPG